MSKKILTRLRLHEISAVDRPAQTGAKLTIMKRGEGDLSMSGETVAKKDHDAVVAKNAELETKLKAAEEEAAAAKKAASEATEAAKRAEVLSKMSGDDRKAFDDMDEDDKKKFFAADEATQKSMISTAVSKARDADPVVYTAKSGDRKGYQFRKSESGMADMQKQLDDQAEQLAVGKAAVYDATVTKRVGEDLSMMKSDAASSLIRAVDKIEDEAERTKAYAELKAANAALETLSKSNGHGGELSNPVAKKAEEAFVAKVEEIAAARGIKKVDAWAAAKREHGDLFKAYDDATKIPDAA